MSRDEIEHNYMMAMFLLLLLPVGSITMLIIGIDEVAIWVKGGAPRPNFMWLGGALLGVLVDVVGLWWWLGDKRRERP